MVFGKHTKQIREGGGGSGEAQLIIIVSRNTKARQATAAAPRVDGGEEEMKRCRAEKDINVLEF